MPEYRKANPSYVVKRDDVLAMFKVLPDLRDRALISFLYIFGPRPSEVMEMLTKDVDIEATRVTVRIPTKKIKSRNKFEVLKRELTVYRPHPRDPIIEEFVKYATVMKRGDPDGRLFPFNHRQRIWDVVARASTRALGFALAPYNFRHSRLTKLARSGATVDELMYWKGARSVKSISPYLHARPVVVSLSEIDKDT